MTPEELLRTLDVPASELNETDVEEEDEAEEEGPGREKEVDPAAYLINACDLLRDIGKFFDIVLVEKQFSKTRVEEMEDFSEAIYALIMDLEGEV